MQTGDLKLVKSINDRLVLNLLRVNKIMSSSELVRITGMRPSTIFNILKDMAAQSLVINLGKGESTEKGGKKPYLWSLNSEAAYALGVDVEVGELTAVVLDFSAEIVAKKIYRIDKFETIDELVRHVIVIVDDLLSESGIDRTRVIGLGVGIAGVVNVDTGVVVMTDVFQEMNVPMLDALKKHYSFPVIVENNANASAVGDKWVGVARESRNSMTVLMEFDRNVHGFGIGVIVNEELYRGSSYCAGELNLPMSDLGEMLTNVRSLLRTGPILKRYDVAPVSVDTRIMIDAAKKGDPVATSFFNRLGSFIGKRISSIIGVLNPDMLIISGDLAELEELIIAPVKNAIEMETLSITSDVLKIVTSSHGHYSVAMGAASVILGSHFKVPDVRSLNSVVANGVSHRVAEF
jgi:N-acetylglucosamine repressor